MTGPVASTTSQTFRSTSSSGSVFVININPRHDSKSGSKVILWNDVQRVFKNAQFIMNGDAAVSFLTDDNFDDLIPLRISFHPEVILDVILEGSISSPAPEEPTTFPSTASPQLRTDSNSGPRTCHELGEGSIPSPTSTPPISRQPSIDTKQPTSNSSSSTSPRNPQDRSLTSTITTTISAGTTTVYLNNDHSSTVSPQPTVRAPASVLSKSLSEVYLGPPALPLRPRSDIGHSWSRGSIVTVPEPSVPSTVANTDTARYRTSAAGIDTGGTYDHSIPPVTHQPGPQVVTDIRTAQSSHRKQVSSQQPQPVAILSDTEPSQQVRKQIESVMSLQYRLIAAPCPRHFIVVPNRVCLYDDKIVPTYDTFRLFFLCDCGNQEIHISDHEGYNLDRAADFFDQFGAYTLVMMQVFKYKILSRQSGTGSGQYSAPIRHLAQTMLLDKDIIEHYTNLMISHLQKAQLEKEEDGIVSEEIHYDGTPFLGTDRLEKLHSFLLGPGEEQKHGRAILLESTETSRSTRTVVKKEPLIADLYQTVDKDGYAHWMCLPHFKARFLDFDPQHVYSWCRAFNGQYNAQWSSLGSHCESPPSTKYLSELSKLHGIVTLAIDFSGQRYNQAMTAVCDTVLRNMPAQLLLRFESGSCTRADMLAGCMDPILTMMTSPQTQAFSFLGSTGGLMLERVASQLTITRAPKLRYIKWNIDSIDKETCLTSKQGLYKLLNICDNLEELWIEWFWLEKTMTTMVFARSVSATLWLLSKLTIFSRDLEATFTVKDGQLLRASQVRVSNLESNHDVLMSGLLTKLTIAQRIYLSKPETRDVMLEIIRKNPHLVELELECWSGDLDGTEVAIRTSLGGTCEAPHQTLKTLRIQSVSEEYQVWTVFDLTKQQSPEAATLEVTIKNEDDDLDITFLMYSASITKIVTKDLFSGHLLHHLDDIACRPVTRLIHLDIGLMNLGDSAIKSLQSVIDRSPNLKVLRFLCLNLGGPQTRQRALSMVTKYRSRLTGLELSGSAEQFWVKEFQIVLPNLKVLPVAKEVVVTCVNNSLLSLAQREWIESMQLSPIGAAA
ncbi:hypothetical protein BGZ59_010188 [Podila verticillata]|nr:hypothetical protein BGZ59_010188 [Podila verticillata]